MSVRKITGKAIRAMRNTAKMKAKANSSNEDFTVADIHFSLNPDTGKWIQSHEILGTDLFDSKEEIAEHLNRLIDDTNPKRSEVDTFLKEINYKPEVYTAKMKAKAMDDDERKYAEYLDNLGVESVLSNYSPDHFKDADETGYSAMMADMDFDNEREFDDYLNNTYESLADLVTMGAGRTLYEVDPTAFNVGLSDWVSENKDEEGDFNEEALIDEIKGSLVYYNDIIEDEDYKNRELYLKEEAQAEYDDAFDTLETDLMSAMQDAGLEDLLGELNSLKNKPIDFDEFYKKFVIPKIDDAGYSSKFDIKANKRHKESKVKTKGIFTVASKKFLIRSEEDVKSYSQFKKIFAKKFVDIKDEKEKTIAMRKARREILAKLIKAKEDGDNFDWKKKNDKDEKSFKKKKDGSKCKAGEGPGEGDGTGAKKKKKSKNEDSKKDDVKKKDIDKDEQQDKKKQKKTAARKAILARRKAKMKAKADALTDKNGTPLMGDAPDSDIDELEPKDDIPKPPADSMDAEKEKKPETPSESKVQVELGSEQSVNTVVELKKALTDIQKRQEIDDAVAKEITKVFESAGLPVVGILKYAKHMNSKTRLTAKAKEKAVKTIAMAEKSIQTTAEAVEAIINNEKDQTDFSSLKTDALAVIAHATDKMALLVEGKLNDERKAVLDINRDVSSVLKEINGFKRYAKLIESVEESADIVQKLLNANALKTTEVYSELNEYLGMSSSTERQKISASIIKVSANMAENSDKMSGVMSAKMNSRKPESSIQKLARMAKEARDAEKGVYKG